MNGSKAAGRGAPGESSSPQRTLLIALALALLSLAAFHPVLDHDFVRFDDPLYVVDNAWVQQGLTPAAVRWALGARVANHWHPVTLLSHLLDCELFGLDPRGHHLTSLVLHAANVALLFVFLWRATARRWPSVLAAALFAVHPLRVETVAWVADRKDLVSTFFLLLTLLAYVSYARRRTALKYLAALAALALGLGAKSMLVTAPAVLLLLDDWPLRRLASEPADRRWRRLGVEKLPFLLLAAAAAGMTLVSQRGVMAPAEALPFSLRLANGLVAYVAYLGKTVWPRDLAVFYPLPESIPGWKVALAAAVLLAVTALALRLRRRAPYLAFGWLWYLGTLVPVLGLFQAGAQAMADRYTYVPSIGLFVALAWGLAEWAGRAGGALRTGERRVRRRAVAAAGLAAVAALAVASHFQLRHWTDSEALFRRAMAVGPPTNLVHVNLAEALRAKGRRDEALHHYRAALVAAGATARDHAALGNALASWGRYQEALAPLERAVELDPEDPLVRFTLGGLLATLGRGDEAVIHLKRAVELDPAFAPAHLALGQLLLDQGREAEGRDHRRRAAELGGSEP